jgi:chorismate mutase / prephenate dehydratase
MGKRKTKTDPPAAAKRKRATRPPRPAAVRSRIARLDRQLVGLVQRRAALVLAAGDGLTAIAGIDEELQAANGHGPLPWHSLRAVLREGAGRCRGLGRQPRVAFLGPIYSLGHLAAMHCFGHGCELVPVGSAAAVFEELSRKQSDCGLAPLQDSTDGRVADTVEMLVGAEARICGEVELRIHHVLLGKCSRTEVREVYSRPGPLSQCRNWLAKHLPTARPVEVTSTATAAQLACEKPGAAAIACRQAGEHYGLTALAENIEDNGRHMTRFAVIGNQSPPRTGNDRTAMLIQVRDRVGALTDAIAIFKRNRVNLTRIESLRLPQMEHQGSFLVEMEGHQSESRLRRAAAALRRKVLRLDILGSFPATAPVE